MGSTILSQEMETGEVRKDHIRTSMIVQKFLRIFYVCALTSSHSSLCCCMFAP